MYIWTRASAKTNSWARRGHCATRKGINLCFIKPWNIIWNQQLMNKQYAITDFRVQMVLKSLSEECMVRVHSDIDKWELFEKAPVNWDWGTF